MKSEIMDVRPMKLNKLISFLNKNGVRSKQTGGTLIKFYFKTHVWTLHSTGKEVKLGAVRELKKICLAEKFFD